MGDSSSEEEDDDEEEGEEESESPPSTPTPSLPHTPASPRSVPAPPTCNYLLRSECLEYVALGLTPCPAQKGCRIEGKRKSDLAREKCVREKRNQVREKGAREKREVGDVEGGMSAGERWLREKLGRRVGSWGRVGKRG